MNSHNDEHLDDQMERDATRSGHGMCGEEKPMKAPTWKTQAPMER